MITSAGEFFKYLKLFQVPTGSSSFSPYNSSWLKPNSDGISIGNTGKAQSAPSGVTIDYFGTYNATLINLSSLQVSGSIYGFLPTDATTQGKISTTSPDINTMVFCGSSNGTPATLWSAEDNTQGGTSAGWYTQLPIVNYGAGPGRKKITAAGTTTLTSLDAWVNITAASIAVTFNLPDENTILDGHEVEFSIQAAITSITLASPNSKTISTGTLPITAHSYFTVHYDAADATWYRIR